MNSTALLILTLSLCAIALVACFVPRIAASLIAYGALVCGHVMANDVIDTGTLVFWAIATVIVLGLRLLQPASLNNLHAGSAYVAGGTAAGAFIGVVLSPVSATIIIGAAAGAFLGAVAFMRTPKGLHLPIASRSFLDYLCAKGLPLVVACSMIAITTIVVLPQ